MAGEIDMKEYGRLLQQVETLTETVGRLEIAVGQMNDLMQQSKGGYKTIAWIAGIAGAAGSAITWIAAHYRGVP